MDYGEKGEFELHSSWSQFLAAPKRKDGRLILFTTKAARPYVDFDFSAGDTLLFGRESAGVPEEVHARAEARLVIPIRADLRSINVATAAAMALGEALRQTRGFPSPPLPS